ncbi:MAG: ASCH domain-containing protein [Persicimonas sp.]
MKVLTIKVLTIKAPWAQAIVHGTKRIENRTWKPHSDVMGEVIALHCGKSMVRIGDYDDTARDQLAKAQHKHLRHERGERTVRELGCIIGTARVVGWYDVRDDTGDLDAVIDHTWLKRLAVTAVGYDLDLKIATDDPWWLGPIGWLLDDVRLAQPVEARGMPGLWTVPDEIELVEV